MYLSLEWMISRKLAMNTNVKCNSNLLVYLELYSKCKCNAVESQYVFGLFFIVNLNDVKFKSVCVQLVNM